MKLIKIKINNIASIEEAEIQFSEGVLASTSRYLICGDMGTGKSTLLDSICLALYNNTPRLSQAPNNVRNYGLDKISAQDPRNLLRHGANEGSVELQFEGSDGKNYTAKWICGRTRNHTLRDTTHLLTCDNEIISNKREIENRIKESAVGLDFQQFCRTTLLAQGQFTQFLKSKENEKSAILEKLTQTDIYSTVGKEIAKISKEKEEARKKLENNISGAQLLEKEQIDELNNIIESCNKQLSEKKSEKEINEKKRAWLTHVTEAQDKLNQAKERYTQLKNIIESTEYQNEKTLINDWNASSEGRYLLKSNSDLQKLLHSIETDQIPKGQNCFKTATLYLNDFQQTMKNSQSELNSLKQKIDEEAPHSEMYRNAQTLVASLDNVLKHSNTKLQLTKRESDLENDRPKLEKIHQESKDAQKQYADKVHQAQVNEERMKQELNDLHPDELRVASQKVDKDQQQLLHAKNCCNTLNNLYQSVLESKDDLNKSKHALKEKQAKIEELQPIADERKSTLDKAKNVLEKTKLALGDESDRLRAQLHAGDTCPICGHIIDQLMDTSSLQAILEPQKQQVKQAEDNVTEILGQIKAADEIVKKYQNDIQDLSKKTSAAEKKLKDAAEDAKKACMAIQISINEINKEEIQAALTAISEQEKNLQKEKENLSERQNTINKKNEEIIEEQKKNKALIAQERQIALDVEKNAAAVKECERAIKELTERIREEQTAAEKELEAAAQLITWHDWENEWRENPQMFVQKLRKSADEYEKHQNQFSDLSRKIESQKSQLSDIIAHRTEILKQWPDWATNTKEAQHTDNISEEWRNLAQKSNTLHLKYSQCKEDIDANEKKISTFLQQHSDLTRERIEELSKLADDQVPTKKHQQYDRDFSVAENTWKQASSGLEEAQSAPHPEIGSDETLEKLQEVWNQLEEESNKLIATQGEASGRLRQNEINQHAVADKSKELENLKHTEEQWKKLSGLFGTSDGTAFRNIAQSFLLQNLVRSANEYLKELTQRYRLDCIPGTLTLSLRDMYQGEVESPVDTLSGGESFLVSLSLALALSSINRKGFSIDTLFIDEGFGNLSSNELETVLNMLARLQKMNGKRVGIISHVESVKEHIPVHVEVTRIDPTRSRVNVVDLSRR